MQDKVSTETIRICTTRPEKVCDSQLAREMPQTSKQHCKLFYESGILDHLKRKTKRFSFLVKIIFFQYCSL